MFIFIFFQATDKQQLLPVIWKDWWDLKIVVLALFIQMYSLSGTSGGMNLLFSSQSSSPFVCIYLPQPTNITSSYPVASWQWILAHTLLCALYLCKTISEPKLYYLLLLPHCKMTLNPCKHINVCTVSLQDYFRIKVIFFLKAIMHIFFNG